LTALPPLHTTPALTDPNDTESPSTIPTLATPSSQSLNGNDYFGEDGVSPRSKAKSKKPIMIRNHTASMSLGNAARLQAEEGTQEAQRGTEDGRNVQTDESSALPLRSKYSESEDMQTPKTTQTSDSSRHKRPRTGDKSEKEKKAMLSKALQKANTAVLLDNAQNYEGALEAYSDACRLLQQVMDRSSGVDDKRKLDSIRITYTNRVEELKQMEILQQPELSNEKSLPTRPMSDESLSASIGSGSARSPTIDSHIVGSPIVETAATAHVVTASRPARSVQQDRDSVFSAASRTVEVPYRKGGDGLLSPASFAGPTSPDMFRYSPTEDHTPIASRSLELPLRDDDSSSIGSKKAAAMPPLSVDGVHIPPDNSRYMPAPLSPRRPSVPEIKHEMEQIPSNEPLVMPGSRTTEEAPPEESSNASSWLDPIDESESDRSSVHSVSSQQGIHRKHIRGASGDTNPDLDVAFDAAVEAVYNEGFEPDIEGERNVEPAPSKHTVKQSIIVPASDIKEILSPTNNFHPGQLNTLDLDDEEEERLLDDITSDYAQTFSFDLSTKSALPRQSDSSGYSRSTWQSSQISDRTTAGTSLSTVAEDTSPMGMSKNAFAASASLNGILSEPPSAPPPQGSLPQPPSTGQNRTSGVRSRRLSGQNLKQLKIETVTARPENRSRASTFHHTASPFKEEEESQGTDEFDKDFKFGSALEPSVSEVSEQQHERMLASPPSLDILSTTSDVSRPLTATTVTTEQRKSIDDAPGELHSLKPSFIRKNKSSLSLREHTVIAPSPTEAAPASIVTPMSSTFMSMAAKRFNEAPLHSQRATLPAFTPAASDSLPGGVYLFDTSLSSAQLPTSPRSPSMQPTSLEPCPDSFLLRPFWLMRAIASTLVGVKGGFLTTKLFVPREVWQTKGVKLKSVEEKIANCDLLTAALGRLSGVDTYDADALMEELQNFEEVMERVQSSFVKRLGSDVGISGLAGIFKDAAGATSTAPSSQNMDTHTPGAEKTKSKESKGYLNSWRKLRSKSSGAPVTSGQTNRAHVNKTAEKEALPLMPSVPMTSYVPVERRGQRKDARNLTFDGPNREYMGSLARLFESVQVLGKSSISLKEDPLQPTSSLSVGDFLFLGRVVVSMFLL
jgi:hypothetical protein